RAIEMRTAIAVAGPVFSIVALLLQPAWLAGADAMALHPAEAGLMTTSLFDGRTLDGGIQVPENSWVVKDGAMASTGGGRGVIYTQGDYEKFRLLFTMRHVSGEKDHRACVLIFCARPQAGEKPLDALAGIQFQPPNGGHWDYRQGHNNAGNDYFVR